MFISTDRFHTAMRLSARLGLLVPLCLGVFLVLCGSLGARGNILDNPGFESGSGGPNGWMASPPSPPGVTYSWDASTAYGGSRSVAIEGTQTGINAMWRQVVPVVENMVYTYAGYLNVSDVKDPGFCVLELVFRDSGNQILAMEDVLRHHGTIEWIDDLPHEKCFRAPVGAVAVEVNLRLTGLGTVWFDDIFFGPTPTGCVSGTVCNGAAPVAGARVEVWGTDLEAFTDVEGRYLVSGLPVASPRYVLIASHPSYRSQAEGNVGVQPGAVTDVDFVLRPGPELAVGELRVKCGRIVWRGDVSPRQVVSWAIIDPGLYPPEVLPYLASHDYIDCDHPLVMQTAAEILSSVDPALRDNTLAVSHAAYLWIVSHVEWDGVYSSPSYTDVTSGAWQTISGAGWSYGNSFAEWLYKPSETLTEKRGICIEHSRLATALLRALSIPARPIMPYGAQFWVQPPTGDGYWATMSTSGGRSDYKTSGDEWGGYACTPDSRIFGFPVDAGGWIHSDWWTATRSLWRETHPWSERYEGTQSGFDQAVADLKVFELTGEAPIHSSPPVGTSYNIEYSDFTLDLRSLGTQRDFVARFPLPVETPVVFDMHELAYWTDHPECVTSTWYETEANPPVAENLVWFNIEFDLTPLLPPVELELCDLEANGSDDPVVLAPGERLAIELNLDPTGLLGVTADWWVAAATPFGWYSYKANGQWVPGVERTFAGLIVPVWAYTVLDTGALPAGDYDFFFSLDAPDGLPQGTVFDRVEVTIE